MVNNASLNNLNQFTNRRSIWEIIIGQFTDSERINQIECAYCQEKIELKGDILNTLNRCSETIETMVKCPHCEEENYVFTLVQRTWFIGSKK